MEYDDYFKDKSLPFSKTQKSLLMGMIKHGMLQEDDNIKLALKIIDSEIAFKKMTEIVD